MVCEGHRSLVLKKIIGNILWFSFSFLAIQFWILRLYIKWGEVLYVYSLDIFLDKMS